MKRGRTTRDATETKSRVRPNPNLPIRARKHEILSAISNNDVVVIVAETASGKTTQIPQILLEHDPSFSIVVTQPRRVAAISVANRVAAERGTTVGDEVGYTVRFDDKCTPGVTRIRYVTDGILAREAISMGAPAMCHRYSHIIIDEVHERSVNTDILLGIIKLLFLTTFKKSRSTPPSKGILSMLNSTILPFKVVIMSATTDTSKILNFFNTIPQMKVPLLDIQGSGHDVPLLHASFAVSDYIEGAVQTAIQHLTERKDSRDVLIFLPGKEDIQDAITIFKRDMPREKHQNLSIFPLHSSLLPEDQLKAVSPLPPEYRETRRKVIFATNIAETSVTIPDIDAVVDSGLVKVRDMNGKKNMAGDVLSLRPISKAQAQQRVGRTGRTGPGRVYRLYTSKEYDKMDAFPKPEILRINACNTLLQITAITDLYCKKAKSNKEGEKKTAENKFQDINVRTFPLLDPIPRGLMEHGLETLIVLGALDTSMKLTQVGRLMCRFPVPPMLARSLLESVRVGCADAMLSVAAVLSTDGTIFLYAPSKQDKAIAAQRRFRNPSGDHLTMANVLHTFMLMKASKRSEFCRDHFLNARTLTTALSVRKQLDEVLRHSDMITWALENPLSAEISSEIADTGMDELVRRCLVAGFFRNVAQRRESDNGYITLESGGEDQNTMSADIHPGSSIMWSRRKKLPQVVIYDELVVTSKAYLRTVVSIERRWLTQHSSFFMSSRKDHVIDQP